MSNKRKFDLDLTIRTCAGLFADFGYHLVSIGDLCSYTGVQRGSLYMTFPNGKEMIAQKCLADYLGSISSSSNYDDRMQYYCTDVRNVPPYLGCNCLFTSLYFSYLSLPDGLKADIGEAESRFISEVGIDRFSIWLTQGSGRLSLQGIKN